MRRTRGTPGPLGLSLGSGGVGAAVVGVGGLVVGALVAGLSGLLSALTGVVVVVLFFVVSLWLVEVANRVNPSLTLPVGMTVYGVLLVWLGLLAYGTSLPEHLHKGVFAWTVIAVTLGWLVAQAVTVWRTRMPYVLVDLPTHEVEPEPARNDGDPLAARTPEPPTRAT